VIGYKERLRNNLYFVEWEIKPCTYTSWHVQLALLFLYL